MSLADRCKPDISAADWRKGGDYCLTGAVRKIKLGNTSLVAKVFGTSRYTVTFDWSRAEGEQLLQVDCTCPRFAEMGICKHVAATIRQVDREGLDHMIPGRGLLRVAELQGSIEDEFEEAELEYAGDDEFDDDEEWDPYDDESDAPAHRQPGAFRAQGRQFTKSVKRSAPEANLKQRFTQIENTFYDLSLRTISRHRSAQTKPRQLYFSLDLDAGNSGQIVVAFWQRTQLKNGDFGLPKEFSLDLAAVAALEDAAERELLSMLLHCGQAVYSASSYYGYAGSARLSRLGIPTAMFDVLLPRLCATGKFGPRLADLHAPEVVQPLAWDAGGPWQFRLRAASEGKNQAWKIDGELYRADEIVPLSRAISLASSGLVIFSDRLARWTPSGDWPWVLHLRRGGPLTIKKTEVDEAVAQLYSLPHLPPLELPAEWKWRVAPIAPQPCIKFSRPKYATPQAEFFATVSFKYGEIDLTVHDDRAATIDRQAKQIALRDMAAESQWLASLRSRGFRKSYYSSDANCFDLPPKKFMTAVENLIADNWQVEAEGKSVRTPGQFNISVTSGVDWFDLAAECDFGGITATLPELLAAVRKGENFVLLSDGSRGMLPQEWLNRYSSLADLGQTKDAVLRFTAPQAAILDALLASQPKVEYDVAFTRIRRKLQQFDGIAPKQEPATFQGTLREYQREGLGWLHFLQEFGYGGCLADDMGLGKTVQVLALLEARRKRNGKKGTEHRPTLVVVPKSLVFNWLDEAGRFAPKLRTCDYTGLQRAAALDRLDEIDLLVTTYGTLRRDIVKLSKIQFDYVILDEAQAIKNANSQSAKTCRLLQAQHRLAMTGTPVENHLGELWSLFEFLNPGMLGRSGQLFSLAGKGRTGDTDSLDLLRRALRPYMLRRTKSQVLKELPDKTEQTLHCDLEGDERKRYDELRDHYRDSLLKRIDAVGLKKAKMHVLEALLRLRQAACHGGLIDKKRTGESSSKLELLLEHLQEVRAEGHKALVFSQFTSFLDIVRGALDKQKIVYEYLDGKTRDRQARVERFQTDDKCPLFLISLKAGGHGLNLTAADYVFILDPWWNPAVEMQAIDRAHRIGQTKPVFAYRLIARNTVEEKILELQQQKRELAEAIIAADDRLLANLSADDLRLLLS